ncbi:MAG: ECF-type sigma factor [Hyphomonas sp.]
MSDQSVNEVTRLLIGSETGGDAAFSMAVERLYPELRRLAGYHSPSAGAFTLSATDILHEAFLKLSSHNDGFKNRNHFMAVASKAMRQVIIDYARRKATKKRAGNMRRVDFDDVQIGVMDQAEELLMLDQALDALSIENLRAARVFECRFFGGMTDKETSEALAIPLRTAQREWMKAKAFMSHFYEVETQKS